MARPSVMRQLPDTVPTPTASLAASPRHWNAGLGIFRGVLWMAYRHHKTTPDSRCGISMIEINPKTRLPVGKSYALPLVGQNETDHFEDPRLFVFNGALHVSYTEMTGYQPGVSYNCVMKYARLARLKSGAWKIAETFYPKYGDNDGTSREKNWVFFENEGKLHVIYKGSPTHIVLELNGNDVVNEYQSQAAVWPFGVIRGGASPLLMGRNYLHVFHSSMPSEMPPHFVRYYMGAYTFSAEPPFTPVLVSERPIAAGSEQDEHKVDPRYVEGWKPLVVFPCGLVPAGDDTFFVSMGVNDWRIMISKLTVAQLDLIPADGSTAKSRYFWTANGSMPARVLRGDLNPKFEYLRWTVPRPGPGGVAGSGYMKAEDLNVAEQLAGLGGVREISEKAFLWAAAEAPCY